MDYAAIVPGSQQPACVHFGQNGVLECPIPVDRLDGFHVAPASIVNLPQQIRDVCDAPLDFPPPERMVVPGDKVAIVVDRHTPAASSIVAEVVRRFVAAGVVADEISLVTPAGLDMVAPEDPRRQLPDDIRSAVQWHLHDPTDPKQRAYLATTAHGERLYLSRPMVEADAMLTIGQTAFDTVLGIRGTNSALYPGLSTPEAIRQSHGLGHEELDPEDERPLRQLVDETGWLIGAHFSIQVIAGPHDTASAIFAGATDAVFRAARSQLIKSWQFTVPRRSPMVVVAVDYDSAGHSWHQIGAALSVGRRLVTRGGKIVLLTDFNAETGDGIELLRKQHSPGDAIQVIRNLAPPDLVPAVRIAAAADWANVYLLSKMPSATVEELFMTPLETTREAGRLIELTDRCLMIDGAQHVWANVASSRSA